MQCTSSVSADGGAVLFEGVSGGRTSLNHLGEFPSFVSGQRRFPWPVYVIGGNHEPYGWLDDMPEGGQLALNCSSLGRAGCRDVEAMKCAFSKAVDERLKTKASGAS